MSLPFNKSKKTWLATIRSDKKAKEDSLENKEAKIPLLKYRIQTSIMAVTKESAYFVCSSTRATMCTTKSASSIQRSNQILFQKSSRTLNGTQKYLRKYNRHFYPDQVADLNPKTASY